jgi:hypothetical protein
MRERYNSLLLLALLVTILALLGGCSQPDDVLAPVYSTQLILSPSRLPSPPSGMVYELWLTKNSGEYLSLGKFNWDSKLYRFYDVSGNVIDSAWTINEDALNYDQITLTIEEYPDAEPDSMGPIMLADTLRNPSEDVTKMIFPMDLWLGQAGFCITTPTDKNSYSKRASGVWFSYYMFNEVTYADTFDVTISTDRGTRRPLYIDTTWDSTQIPPTVIKIDTTNLTELAQTLDTLRITNEGRDTNLYYIIYLDTFVHITSTFDFKAYPVNVTKDTVYVIDTLHLLTRTGSVDVPVTKIDTITIAPFMDYGHTITYPVAAIANHTDTLDYFLPNYQDIPDLNGTKWHYKGWIVSSYLAPSASFGALTKPCWLGGIIDFWINSAEYGLITTGSFKSFDAPDGGNPYSLSGRVPQLPGEDFLTNLPDGLGPRGIYFADSLIPTFTNPGTVIITLEPDNYNNDSTNFPLILFTNESAIPSYNTIANNAPHVADYRLRNWSSAVDGNTVGFPAIKVSLIRQ